tara:strand:- start:858 stop:1499 length:642 start_codon:yes stop_codon:yes gene_type:complete
MQDRKDHLDDPFWVNEPNILFRPDRLIEIYPTIDMTPNERVNSISRFILVCGIAIVLAKRENMTPLIVAIAAVSVIATLYYPKANKDMLVATHKPVEGGDTVDNVDRSKACKDPTLNNPFMNVLPGDSYKHNLPACDDPDGKVQALFKSMYGSQDDVYNKAHAQRQFYTAPNKFVSNEGRESFAKALYGEAVMNKCKNGVMEDCGVNPMVKNY